MKRWGLRLLLLGSLVSIASSPVEAGGGLFSRKTREQRQAKRAEYPPKWERYSNAQDYIFRGKDGRVHVREVYSGYAEQFPTPALFYYGYPHSGDDTGLGF